MDENSKTIPIRRAEEPAVASEAQGGATQEFEDPIAEIAFLHGRVADMENELAEKNLEISHYIVRATDAENELEMAKERIRRESIKEAKRQRHDLLRGLLEVLDNLDRALDAHPSNASQLEEGVRLVQQHFIKTLGGYGVSPMNAMGKSFSPQEHEALSTMPAATADDDGKVMAVVQKGYTIGEEVLRPAKVVVGRS